MQVWVLCASLLRYLCQDVHPSPSVHAINAFFHAMNAFFKHCQTPKHTACTHCADLCLEDGIDPTCKEEYLTDDEFTEV